MRLLKRELLILLVLTLCITTLVGCGSNKSIEPSNKSSQEEPVESSTSNDKVHLTLTCGMEDTHPITMGVIKFAEILEERSGGRITADIYPNSTLGSDRELVEQVNAGLIDGHGTATSILANYSQSMSVFDLPYLFVNEEHATAVLNSEILEKEQAKLEENSGIKMLTWFKLGWRNVTNSKRPINRLDDMKGIKIRVIENPVMIAQFEAVGAIPTPMAWSELYTALQQKTVDAQENPTYVILNNSLDEVQPYLSLTEHSYTAAALIFSKSRFESFTLEDQELVLQAALEAKEYQVKLAKEREDEAVAKLKERGNCEIVENFVKDPWIEKMRSIYPQFEDKLGKDLIQSIIDFKY